MRPALSISRFRGKMENENLRFMEKEGVDETIEIMKGAIENIREEVKPEGEWEWVKNDGGTRNVRRVKRE